MSFQFLLVSTFSFYFLFLLHYSYHQANYNDVVRSFEHERGGEPLSSSCKTTLSEFMYPHPPASTPPSFYLSPLLYSSSPLLNHVQDVLPTSDNAQKTQMQPLLSHVRSSAALSRRNVRFVVISFFFFFVYFHVIYHSFVTNAGPWYHSL